jgi:tRNA A37 threonylcarbamoyladenosine dehydratase
VGGVGSWCAESLVRSGIRQLTIVDSDRVSITNINRQLIPTRHPHYSTSHRRMAH